MSSPVDPITGGVLGVPPSGAPAGGGPSLAGVLQALAPMLGGRPSAAPQGGPQISRAQIPGLLPAPTVPGTGNSPISAPAAGLNLTAAGITGPGQMQAPTLQRTEWDTKGGRAMALTQNAVQSLMGTANQWRQKRWDQAAAQTEQAFQDQMQYQANMNDALQKGNANGVRYWQKKLQDLQNDPKIGRALKKAHDDPTSPEGVGLQRAYQAAAAQAQQTAALEKTQAEIVHAYAQAQQEQTTAQQRVEQAKRDAAQAAFWQARTTGQIPESPAEAAKRQSQETIQQRHDQARTDAAAGHDQAMRDVAAINANKTQYPKNAATMMKGFSDTLRTLNAQAADLTKQSTVLQNEEDKADKAYKGLHWYNSTHEERLNARNRLGVAQSKLAQLDKKRAGITQKINDTLTQQQDARDQLMLNQAQPQVNVNIPSDNFNDIQPGGEPTGGGGADIDLSREQTKEDQEDQ